MAAIRLLKNTGRSVDLSGLGLRQPVNQLFKVQTVIYKFLASLSLMAAIVSLFLAGATGEVNATLSASLTLVGFLSFVLSTIKG